MWRLLIVCNGYQRGLELVNDSLVGSVLYAMELMGVYDRSKEAVF